MAHNTGNGGDSRSESVGETPETLLCELFAAVLELPTVDPRDSFAELGGDSIRAIVLTVRARAAGLPIRTEDLLTEDTPERLAALAAIRSARPAPATGDRFERPVVDADRPRTLSPLQQHMLDVAGTYGAETEVVQLYVDLSGDLDIARLRTAAQQLVRRHPSCRCRFRMDPSEGRWVREIDTDMPLPWRYHDLEEQEVDEDALLRDERVSRFDPTRSPLFRILLIRRGPERYRLVVTHNNILWDGWSAGILAEELTLLYNAPEEAAPDTPADPYDDYLQWLSRQDRENAIHAWRKVLAGVKQPTLLMNAQPPESIGSTAKIISTLPHSVGSALELRARDLGTTLSTAVQCAWGLTLAETIGSDDIVFGYTTCGRPAAVPSIDRAVGLLINDVPVRMRIHTGDTPADLLTRLRDQHAEMTPYEFLDSDDIQRAAGFVPLFDTLVVFQNLMRPEVSPEPGPDLHIDGYGIIESIHYALVLYAYSRDRLSFELSYHPNVFDRSFVDDLYARFRYHLELIAEGADRDMTPSASGNMHGHRSYTQ